MAPRWCCCGAATTCAECPEGSSATSYVLSFGIVPCSPFSGGNITMTTSGYCSASVTSGSYPSGTGYNITLVITFSGGLVNWTATVNVISIYSPPFIGAATAVYSGTSDFCKDATELPITLTRTSLNSNISCGLPSSITISNMTL